MCFFDSHLVQLTSPSWPNWQGWHCTPKEVRKGRTARLRRWALPYVKLATRKVKTSLPNDLKKVIGWPLPFFNMLINIWFSKRVHCGICLLMWTQFDKLLCYGWKTAFWTMWQRVSEICGISRSGQSVRILPGKDQDKMHVWTFRYMSEDIVLWIIHSKKEKLKAKNFSGCSVTR